MLYFFMRFYLRIYNKLSWPILFYLWKAKYGFSRPLFASSFGEIFFLACWDSGTWGSGKLFFCPFFDEETEGWLVYKAE